MSGKELCGVDGTQWNEQMIGIWPLSMAPNHRDEIFISAIDLFVRQT